MNLDKHLLAETHPTARAENVVLWGNYRITVLQDRLFRLERNGKRKFRDDATQTVWFRNFHRVPFTVCERDGELSVQTEACTLLVRRARKDCAVLLNGTEIPLTNAENLMGTYRTLDQCEGDIWSDFISKRKKIKLGTGVCSKNGVALFDDAKSLTLGKDGQIQPRKGFGTDEYIFAYGKDFRGAVKALYALTGNVPLLPRYAFGNWWSRYYPYSDESYLTLMNEFEAHDVPLTVAAVDMDWHYSANVDEEKGITAKGRNSDFYGGNRGWTGYSWNTKLFPDYRVFLDKLKERNLKVMLNLHPADGVRWWEDAYPEMARAMNVEPESGRKIEFDISNPQFVNNYFAILHRPYERDGVDFWWVDWQQGQVSHMDGLDPLWALNHYHYLESVENQGKGLILSRYAGIGSHRYPVGFSGDTVISWKTLSYLCYFTQTATNVGYVWWSHDIGGHMLGKSGHELYLRNVQFGVFSPINRMHSSDMLTLTKEPWAYSNGCGKIAEDWLRLRHKLIPFLYSCNYRTANEGLGLIEPMYYPFGEYEQSFGLNEEYYFGDTFIVAPVVSPLQKDGFSYTKVWLPEGTWTDFFTDDIYRVEKGGRYVTMMRRLESIPVLAKEGAIVPLSLEKGNGAENPQKMQILVFAGNGSFDLYEDCGRGTATTRFTSQLTETENVVTQTLRIKTEGERSAIPVDRKLTVTFQCVREGEVSVFCAGKKLPVEKSLTGTLTVAFEYSPEAEYTLTASYLKKSELDRLKERTLTLLTECEDDNAIKFWHTYQPFMNCTTVKELIELIKNSKLREQNKRRILETL